jgi:cytochrome c553
MTRLFVVLLCLTSLITPALAGNAHQGRQLALRWCAGCHQVSPERPRPATNAPPFAEIPRRTALDELRLALYLMLDKIRRMSGRDLSLGDATDLAAYIMSLRQ